MSAVEKFLTAVEKVCDIYEGLKDIEVSGGDPAKVRALLVELRDRLVDLSVSAGVLRERGVESLALLDFYIAPILYQIQLALLLRANTSVITLINGELARLVARLKIIAEAIRGAQTRQQAPTLT